MKIEKRARLKEQPCQRPTGHENATEYWPFAPTLAFTVSYIDLNARNSLPETPYFPNVSNKVCLSTVSNAFSKSIKAT